MQMPDPSNWFPFILAAGAQQPRVNIQRVIESLVIAAVTSGILIYAMQQVLIERVDQIDKRVSEDISELKAEIRMMRRDVYRPRSGSTEAMAAYSTPRYPIQEQGPILIVGSAPCLHEDVIAAMAMRPGAHVMALNEAAAAVRHIDHLYAGHYYKAPHFMAYRQQKLPDAPRRYSVHACWEDGRHPVELVDYWWEGAQSGATSAWTATRIAKGMGYDEVILCGCPMDTSGYFNDGETHRDDEGTPRIGHDAAHPITVRYRENFERLAAEEGEGVFSMSGWTADLLGMPA